MKVKIRNKPVVKVLSLAVFGSFLFYTYGLTLEIHNLKKTNQTLQTKNANRVKEIKKKLGETEKRANVLENILNDKISKIIKENHRTAIPLQRTFFIKKTKVKYVRKNENRKSRRRQDDLQRELASIFAENKKSYNTDFSHYKIKTLISQLAKNELGKKYIWGATGPQCFDCSGFTSSIYKKLGINIPRVSRNQAKHGIYVKRENLKMGDLIFFDTSKEKKGIINHVGIYLGENKFIHASSAKKAVVVTSLNKPFYSQRYKWARRVAGS